MRKRSRYRPKGVNAQAHMVAIVGAGRLSKTDQLTRLAKLDAAVVSILRTGGQIDDWREVFDTLNMVEAFAGMPAVMRHARPFVQSTQEAIVSALDRQKATGAKALKADEAQHLRDLQGVWAELLAVVSMQQYYQAEQRVRRRIVQVLRSSKPEPGVHVVEAMKAGG